MSDTSAPLISRTPSSVCPASPTHQDGMPDNPDRLDDVDGLPVIHCDVQMRLQQIIIEHKVGSIPVNMLEISELIRVDECGNWFTHRFTRKSPLLPFSSEKKR